MTKNNMAIWEALAPVDRKFVKKITGKSYKGDSPNPTYVIQKLTEQFGPIGHKWGFDVVSEKIHLGAPHVIEVERHVRYEVREGNDNPVPVERSMRSEIVREEYHQCNVRFWFLRDDGTEGSFTAIGGTPKLYMTNSGKWLHDEDAAKKSLTDAYTKGASWLGACADIFLGLYDTKYDSAPANGEDDPPASGQQTAQTEGKRKSSTPVDDGWN